ncbi:MAG: hypothetical protein HOP17_01195 [Acidobacteria bacterium]|nr:hypothetical protein [Acidobacteriota bacterium]
METKNNIQMQIAEPEAGSPPAETPPEINQPNPESERLRAENDELKRTLQMRDARDAVVETLTSMGAASPDLLFAAVRDELQFDSEGAVVNAAAITQHLRKTYPDQFGVRRAHVSIDGGAGASSQKQLISAESLARMTPAQIQKLDWVEVRRVLSER